MRETIDNKTVVANDEGSPPARLEDGAVHSILHETDPVGSVVEETQGMSDHHAVPVNNALVWQLYVSHFLSTWNSRLFEFGAVLFLAAIYPGTLLEISIYAVVRGIAAILFAQVTGGWIDRGGRLTVVRASIVLQRVSVTASCLLLWHMDRLGSDAPRQLKDGLFAIVVLLACVEKVSSTMNLVSVERDWVVVITQENELFRSTLNARMRRIDLFCKLLGPLCISLIDIASTPVAIWATVGMNALSVGIEYFAIQNVYNKVPALHERTAEPHEAAPDNTSTPLARRLGWIATVAKGVFPLRSMRYYFSHPAFLPSFSLSLLYLTVLSFSSQMITYLIAVGYTPPYVGLARAVSTCFELSATWIAPRLVRRIGAVRGGIWSLSWQMLWLGAGVAWFFAGMDGHRLASGSGSWSGSPLVPATGLAVGVALSRVGLWCFDLCAQNIIQDEVLSGSRGAFSTAEAAWQNLWEVLSYVTTLVFARPDQFRWPVLISAIAVYAAGALYSFFVRKRRRHLFHFGRYYQACRKKRGRGGGGSGSRGSGSGIESSVTEREQGREQGREQEE